MVELEGLRLPRVVDETQDGNLKKMKIGRDFVV